jgi:alpha-glucosidase (family GH31 glycosyl hydrolase)
LVLRSQLLPYRYNLAYEAHKTAISPLRPMYYSSPLEEAAYNAKAQYMMGDALLVAPIASARDTSTERSTQNVWLPPQAAVWVPFNTSSPVYSGGTQVDVSASIRDIPIFVPAGAIVPTYNHSRASKFGSAAKQVDGLEVLLHLPTAIAEKTLSVYEDDGISNDYLQVSVLCAVRCGLCAV